MRHLALVLLGLGLFFAPEAHAQFANRSISLSVGYLSIADRSVSGGVPIGLGGSLYIENGFDVVLHLEGMILRDQIGQKDVIGVSGSSGIRYLFSEEVLRPYAALELTYLHIFAIETTSNFVGISPSVGLDYFVLDTLSLGLKGNLDVYFALNTPVQLGFGGQIVAAAWF